VASLHGTSGLIDLEIVENQHLVQPGQTTTKKAIANFGTLEAALWHSVEALTT
jgi:hypothetical protein